jgi:recombinational DNA repair protein RecR
MDLKSITKLVERSVPDNWMYSVMVEEFRGDWIVTVSKFMSMRHKEEDKTQVRTISWRCASFDVSEYELSENELLNGENPATLIKSRMVAALGDIEEAD